MPGKQPPRAMTGDLRPGQSASTPEPPSQPPGEPPCRTAKGPCEAGSNGSEPPEPQPPQAGNVTATAPHPGTPPGSSSPWWPVKGGSPQGPPGKGPAQARAQQGAQGSGGPQQLYRLSLSSLRARPAPEEPTEAPQPPKTDGPLGPGPGAPLTPSLQPAPEELGFQRCFQDSCSGFTSTNYTSPSPAPRPPGRAPQAGSASPSPPAAFSEFQGSEAGAWPLAAEDSFRGANFGVHSAKLVPFLEGSRPSGSPGDSRFQYPFPALPADAAQPEFANGALVFAFHQPPGPWQEEPVGPSPAFPLPTPPAPPPLPGYTSRAASLDPPSDPRGALGAPGAAPPAPSPFPASLHESLTKAHPERPLAPQEGVASPRGPLGALPPVHFPGEAFGGPGSRGVGASPGPLDKELASAGPTPAPRPSLWDGDGETLSLMDPAAATYTTTLAPPAAPRGAFFDGQPGPGQQLCLPQSPPLSWPQVVPPPGPSPARLDLLGQLPFPAGAPEWQGASRGTLGGPSPLPRPGDKLAGPSGGPGPPDSSSPALFSYHGLKDPAAPPLFFGVTQPQGSPRLPPPRVVGASPSESPLPSPATNTAGSSSCSSLSPLSSSPANPSSEDSQLPGALGPAAFLHPTAHPQEPGGAFPAPEPLHGLPLSYQPALPEAFPFPAEGLRGEGPFKCLEEAPLPGAGPELGRGGLGGFPRGPPPYPTQHFTLSSASLAQLDVLLTCRQCDQNYSNLAAFLQHRQFCSLLLARAKDGPPGLPAAAPTPKASLLAHSRTASFLLDGDVRAESKEDPLRAGFFPSLPTAPLPLASSELDMEDDAKLDSLITEALSGLEYQPDSPEIDSSFIDVFADEEPSGPRGPSAGLTPKARPGAPAPMPKAPHSGDESRLPPSRPETRSLGPAGQPRRGKRFKWLREELDLADAKGPGRGTRACLRPRRGTNRAEPPPLHPQDFRTQGTKGPADPSQRALQATGLRVETRSSGRLRLPPGKDARKRRPRGGTWGKELIQKIVQQKNKLSRRQMQFSPGVHCSLVTERCLPGAWDGRFRAYDYTSGSEDEGPRQPGSSFKGQSRHGGRRQHQGEKRTDVDTAQGPREEQDQQKPQKMVRQEAGVGRVSPTAEAPNGPPPSPSESLVAHSPSQCCVTGRGPPAPDGPLAASGTETLEASLPSLAISRETSSPAFAEEQPTASTAPLGTVTRLSAACVTGSASLETTGPARPGTDGKLQPSGGLPDVVPQAASPTPDPGGLPEAPRGTGPLMPPNREDSPSCQPGALLVLTAVASDAAPAKPSTLFFKNHFSGDPVGVPVAEEGPPPSRSPPREPFLGPEDLAGRPRGAPCPRPLALDTPSVGGLYLCQGGGGPQHPGDPPSTTEGDPGTTGSPLTLESTALFGGLPEDGFDPLLYDGLSAGRDCHTLFLCAELPPRKPLWDPPCPPLSPEKDWPGLEAGSPVLPPGRQPPAAGTAAPRPPAPPGKASECGGAFGSSLPEDELEIKRLVTELESQLQTSGGASGAPGVLPEADSGQGLKPPSTLPGHQAPAPQEPMFLAEELAALRNSRPFPGGVGTAVTTAEGQPCPGETAPPRSTQESTASRAPGGSPRPHHHFQLVLQKGQVSKTELAAAAREHGIRPDICPPQPTEREAPGSPAAHRTPDLAFQSDEAMAPHPLPAPVSKAGEPGGPGLPQPLAERPHFEGNEGREAPSAPLPDAGRPQDPATSPLRQLQLLVARAAEHEDNTPANPQGLPLANIRSPRPSGPSALAVPAPAGHPRGTGADGHLDLQGQAESLAQEHKGQGQARQLQPDNCGSPGEPETLPARPTGGTDWLQGQHEGSGAAWGLQHGASPAPAVTAAHAARGPEDWALEKVAGLGLKRLLCAGETPGPPSRDPTHGTLLPAEATSPAPCSLEHLPQEDPPAAPAGVLGAPGEPQGLFLASPHCRAPPSPQPLPARAPTWTPLQAPTGAGAEQPLAAPPSVSSSPCAPGEGLACCLTPGEPGLCALMPTHGRVCPEGSVLRTLEGSRKEGQQGSATQAAPSPTVEAITPRVTVRVAGLPVPTTDSTEVVSGWLQSDPRTEVPDPHIRGAPPHTSPGPPCPTAHLGPGEGQLTTAVPTDLSPWGSMGPGAHACLEGEVGGSSGGQEDTGTPGAGCSGFTEVPKAGAGSPTATGPSAALLSRASLPSSTAGDFGPIDSQSHRNVLHKIPQGEPPSPQDTKQKPRGSKKKLVSTGNGQWKKDKTAGVTPVTCEICASSFRSKPGLSRHRARKHRPCEGAASLPGWASLSTHGTLEPLATPAQSPGKKSRKAPGKEKAGNTPVRRSPAATLSPGQSSAAPGDSLGPETPEEVGQGLGPLGTPEPPPSPRPPLPDPSHKGEDTKFPASRPRRPDGPSKARACPRGAGRWGAGPRLHREPGEPPGSSEGKPSKMGRKPRARREKRGAPDLESSLHLSPDVISGRPSANPVATPAGSPAALGPGLSPQGQRGTDGSQLLLAAAPGPGVTAVAEETDPGTPSTEQTRAQEPPGELTLHRGGTCGLSAEEGPAQWDGASVTGMRTLGVCIEPSQAAGHKAAEGGRGSKSGTGEGVLKGHEPPWGLRGPPEMPGAEASGAASSCLQAMDGQAQKRPGNNAEAPSPGPKDPLSLFDDETSFSRLFPLGARRTRKNPRVYGKRKARPKPPAPQPSSPAPRALSPQLPTDLSDSGSLCLSHEGAWDDEAFLFDGLLSSRGPGVESGTPGPSPWAPEPGTAPAGMGQAPPHLHPDDMSECIPELHMVPASWRGLELRAAPNEVGSSCGEASPEPPTLERERYEPGPPGTTSLPLLPAVDYKGLSTKFEMPGPGEVPAELPDASFFDSESAANSPGRRSARTREANGASGLQGRERHAHARRGAYKCRVCFQRFHGLAELDLHKLAHSPSPPPTCYMCVERRFSSRQLLREHLREKHVQGKAGPWACGMCLKEVADVWMYNEHLREHAVRFARRGQARASLQGLPGGWEEDSAVTRFLSSFVGPAAKPHGKTSGGPGEASAPETNAGRETPKQRAKPKARAHAADQGGSGTPDSPSASTTGSCSVAPPSPAPEPWRDGAPPVLAPPVHRACRDPSRHCHHCGKQFPKPFKLQRHLAVHSPQRAYLCPHCPRVYGEPQELQGHLGREHGVWEEPEPPHTPLYACELCAVVMRIIRRSFACSTCNYTFAKKEQFDRHMGKHLRKHRQPFPFRRVRRPGAPGQRIPAREGALPSKRRKVAAPGSPPGPHVDQPLSPGCSSAPTEPSPPALLQPGPEEAPGAAGGQAETQEEPDLQKLPPPSPSPFPAAVADGKGDPEPDAALASSEDKAPLGSSGPLPQETSLPQPEAGSKQDAEGKAARLFSGKRRAPGAPSKRAPSRRLEGPSSVQKEKPPSTCHMGPGGRPGDTAHRDRAAVSTPSKAPKFPPQPRKAAASRTELARDTEDRLKPTPHKAKPEGGSQPQPASGQLQSETASTPAEPNCPGQSPTPNKPPHQAPAKGCSKGPHRSLGARENPEGNERKRKGRAPGPAQSESAGDLGRAPSVPNKPLRNPRKQATPSRVLPPKPCPSSHISRTLLHPGHTPGDFGRRKEEPGKAFPGARPLHRPPKRGRAVHGAESANTHAHQTAGSQSDLLSQLFGQRLTSFKIPLKKDSAE